MNKPIISFDDFVQQIARGTRQTLTTMGKPVGVKPHRRRGEWVFRDRTESIIPLRDLYERLQQTDKGIDWLHGPIRWAEESRQRDLERRNAATGFLKERFAFLTEEFNYSPAFEIPAVEDTYIIAFRNDAAARQVEVSGSGSRFHCEIRRIVDGEPGSYETDSISHDELERVREPAATREVYRSFEEGVTHTIALLRRHGDLLRGESWVEKRDVDAAFDRDFFKKFGFRPGHEPHGWLREAREAAQVLVERHGFELVFDSETLSPHEMSLTYKLIYRRGDTSVEIVLDDFRLDEWFVRLDGKTIHYFRPWSEPELLSAIAAIERALS